MTVQEAQDRLQEDLNDRLDEDIFMVEVTYTLSTDGGSDVLVVAFTGKDAFPASSLCQGTDSLWESVVLPDGFDDSVGREHAGGEGWEMFRFLRKGSRLWKEARRAELRGQIRETMKYARDPMGNVDPFQMLRNANVPAYDERIRFNEGVLPEDAILLGTEEARALCLKLWFSRLSGQVEKAEAYYSMILTQQMVELELLDD
jgi:hypothetical protein